MPEFKTLADAMSYSASMLIAEGRSVPGVQDPLSVGSSFGETSRPTKEIVGFTFTLTEPTAVLIDRPSKPINVAFAFANILWAVSGSDRVQDIAFWNPRAHNFSDDNERINSALGPRIFPSQFYSAISRLREDRSSRRAFLPLISPSDVTAATRDVPCSIGLHLMIRDSVLIAVAMMRSQSALMVLPYDVPLLAAVQCIAAAELDVPPGPFTHISSSLHFYEDELDIARPVADGEVASVSVPELPKLNEMKDLALFESQLREASQHEMMAMASDLVAEPKSYGYSTVVRASLLIDRLPPVASHLTQSLRVLARDIGDLTISYRQHGVGQ